MKEILVDIYKVKDLYSGLGQFSLNFVYELMSCLPTGYKINFLAPRNFRIENYSSESRFLKANFQTRYMPYLNKKFDVWHSLHQFPSHQPGKKTKHIITIHDLNFLTEKNKFKAAKYLKKLQRNVDRANVITAISNSTKNQLEEYVNLKGRSVQTIYNGVKLRSFENAQKPKFIKKDKFFFMLGVFKEKKNFHVLLPVMKHFKNHQLVIAGNKNTNYGEFLSNKIEESGLTENVILPGKISEEEKFWLYSSCEAFLLISSIEGFGLPVIEAMLLGKPVFLSKYGSLPEIGGNSAFYFDNFYEKHMVSIIEEKLSFFRNNTEHQSNLIKKHAMRFSWKSCIEQYLNIYNQVLS